MADVDANPWIGRFDELSEADRLLVAQLIVDGGAVDGNVDELAERLKKARTLALIREHGTDCIIGVAALKNPNPRYRTKTFDHAGVDISDYGDSAELGYVVVAEDMRSRHLSGRLVDLITKTISEPTFATTGSNTMKNNLRRAGFSMVGREWQGQNEALSLWTLRPG